MSDAMMEPHITRVWDFSSKSYFLCFENRKRKKTSKLSLYLVILDSQDSVVIENKSCQAQTRVRNLNLAPRVWLSLIFKLGLRTWFLKNDRASSGLVGFFMVCFLLSNQFLDEFLLFLPLIWMFFKCLLDQ